MMYGGYDGVDDDDGIKGCMVVMSDGGDGYE